MDPDKYFLGYNLKNAASKQKFRYAKNVQFGWELFTLSPVAYIKLENDLFYAGSTLVESEYVKRKPLQLNIKMNIHFDIRHSF